MGIELEFAKDEGPVFQHPIREMGQIERLRIIDPEEDLPFLIEAIRIVRKELDRRIPLIGFSGAPFTLASYIVEGGHSKNYTLTKGMMYQDRPAWDRLMERAFRGLNSIPECADPGRSTGPSAFRFLGGVPQPDRL